MNKNMITQSQQEQTETEATEEYIFEQRMLKLDENLAKLRARLAESHANDRAFNRYLRSINRSVVLCDQCGREAS